MNSLTRLYVRASPLTRRAASVIVLALIATTSYLVLHYDSLPWLLPVHFRQDGTPNGWQYKTLGRVFMPIVVQLALAFALGGIATVLLSRRDDADPGRPDVKAAVSAAEAVVLLTAIWVLFQAYAAVTLTAMWTRERDGLGSSYVVVEIVGFFLSAVVAMRARSQLGHPKPLPYVPEHWRLGQLYKNANDPALFVPTRDGSRWTLNFGRPVAAVLLAMILLAGAVIPTILLALALR